MGQFSWIVDGKKDAILESVKADVYLLVPEHLRDKYGPHFHEKEYEGYGVFGGKDAYAFLHEMNSPDTITGDDDIDRDAGIDIFFGGTERFFEIRFSRSGTELYENAINAINDPNQGWGE